MDLFEMMMSVEANVLKSRSESTPASRCASPGAGSFINSNDNSQQSAIEEEFIPAKKTCKSTEVGNVYVSPKREKLKPRNRSVKECGTDKLVWANNPWFKGYLGKLGRFFPARICNDQEGAVVAIDPKFWPIPEDRVLIQYICPPVLSNEFDVIEKKDVFPYYQSKESRDQNDAEKKKSTKPPTLKASRKDSKEIWNNDQAQNLYLLLSPHGNVADINDLMTNILEAMDSALEKAKSVDQKRAEINRRADEDDAKEASATGGALKRKRGRPPKVKRGDGDENNDITNSQFSTNSQCSSEGFSTGSEPVVEVDLLSLARQNRSDCGNTEEGDWVLSPGDWIAYEHLVFKSVTVYSQVHRLTTAGGDALLLINGDVVNPSEAIRKLKIDESGKPINDSGVTKSLSKFKLRGFK